MNISANVEELSKTLNDSTTQLEFNQAVYDMDIISGSGPCPYVNRILEGNVKLSQEVTRF